MPAVREVLLGVALSLAAASVTYGASLWSTAAAWVVGGVLAAAIACLFLLEVGD